MLLTNEDLFAVQVGIQQGKEVRCQIEHLNSAKLSKYRPLVHQKPKNNSELMFLAFRTQLHAPQEVQREND